jgi:hypothetical protein
MACLGARVAMNKHDLKRYVMQYTQSWLAFETRGQLHQISDFETGTTSPFSVWLAVPPQSAQATFVYLGS